jgi:hypothetical protein
VRRTFAPVAPVSYYAGGLDANRVLFALAAPCIAATLGVGVACGLLRFTLSDALFLGALFALAGAALAGGLTLMLFAALGDRAGPKPLRAAERAGAKRHQALVLARR